MPNRYVRESAIESERVNQLSWQGEVFFRRLINRVDDFGRFTGNTALLRASLFPLQIDKVSSEDVARLVQECQEAELLATYEVDSKLFVVMNQWERGRAKESRYPPPPEDIFQRMKTHVYTRKHLPTDVPDTDTDTDTDEERESKPRERPFPSVESCEEHARKHAPDQHAEFAASVAREFHGVFSAMEPPWITRGGDDLTRSEKWKHKLNSKLESELRNQISRERSRGKPRNPKPKPEKKDWSTDGIKTAL